MSRWQDSPQLGYEILPNKYFYRYQPPTPAKDLLEEQGLLSVLLTSIIFAAREDFFARKSGFGIWNSESDFGDFGCGSAALW